MDKNILCLRCNADNDALRKFCKSCGSPLGILCDRCGSVNRFEDKFCGICGLSFVIASQQTNAPEHASGRASSVSSKQYTAADIEELLTLRRALRKQMSAIDIVNQHDIDTLFEEP
jgi:hypothetical protein